MQIEKHSLDAHNEKQSPAHQKKWLALRDEVANADEIVKKLIDFQIAIPSWALGTGGTTVRPFCRWRRTADACRKLKT